MDNCENTAQNPAEPDIPAVFWDFCKMADLIQAQADYLATLSIEDTDADVMNLNDVMILDIIASIYRWDKYRMNRWKERFFCVGPHGETGCIFVPKWTEAKFDPSMEVWEVPHETWEAVYAAIENQSNEYHAAVDAYRAQHADDDTGGGE